MPQLRLYFNSICWLRWPLPIWCFFLFIHQIPAQTQPNSDSILVSSFLQLKPAIQADSILDLYHHFERTGVIATLGIDDQVKIYSHTIRACYENVAFDSAGLIYQKAKEKLVGKNRVDLETNLKEQLILIQGGRRKFGLALATILEIIPYYESKRDLKRLASLYGNLGICYRNTGDFKLAEHYYQKAIALHKDLDQLETAGFTCFNLAYLYIVQKKYVRALNLLDRSEQLLIKEYGTYNYQMATIDIKRGECYRGLDQLDTAEKFYHQAVNKVKSLGLPVKTARVVLDLAIFYHKTSQYDKALPRLDSVLQLVKYDPDDISRSAREPITALHALKWKYWSQYLLFKENNSRSMLRASYATVKEAYDLLEEDVKGYLLGGMKDRMIRHHQDIISRFSVISYELWKTDPENISLGEVLSYMDRGKNLRFYEKQWRQNSLRDHLPIEEIEVENRLRAELSNLYAKRGHHLAADTLPMDSIDIIEASISKLTLTYEKTTRMLAEISPGYFDNTLSSGVDTQKLSQFLCETNTLLLQYFYQEEDIFCLAMHCDTAAYFKTSGNIDSLISKFQEGINVQSSVELTGLLDTMYDLLLRQPLKSFDLPFDKLLVSPFRSLSLFPFEPMMHRIPENSNKSKVQRVPVSYNYNLRSLDLPKSKIVRTTYAFAPRYQAVSFSTDQDIDLIQRSDQFNLPGAMQEAKQIATLFGGTAFTGSGATKASFIETSNNADILHLGLHAFVDHENPFNSYLLFAEDSVTNERKLMLEDIFNLNLKAKLAVLGACGSGLGNISIGEGVSSLALGFNYVGISSTIMSLWNVPDKSASEIFVSFYQGLKNGLDKDVALQDAKNTYLENCVEPELRHPFYWAGFIAQGDMSPIELSSDAGVMPVKWIVAILIAVVTLGYLISLGFSKSSSGK